MSISSKQLLYTILLNSDTEKIVDEYVIGYIKNKPELLAKLAKEITHPLVDPIITKMEQQYNPTPNENRLKVSTFIISSILSEFSITLSEKQLKAVYSVFTEEQLLEIQKNLDPPSWF